MFKHLPNYPGDPILGLLERFNRDPRPNKVNLGIGVYYDEHGHIPVLECVRQIANQCEAPSEPCMYLPMEGDARYLESVRSLLFADSVAAPHFRTAMIQTLGGSGALKVGADFLANAYPKARVWVGRPTWDNHVAIFQGTRLEVCWFPHYESKENGFAAEAAQYCLQDSTAGDIVLLHACCHNPTGIQPSQEQWLGLLDVIQQRKLIPFIDIAYQGFGESLDEDAWLIRECCRRGIEFLVASSFSKNFAMYGERLGTLSVHVAADNYVQVLGQLKVSIRRNYSSPPRFGASVIGKILGDQASFMQWSQEVSRMRARVKAVRSDLAQRLSAHAYIDQQQGLFAYLSLSAAQVHVLRDRHGVYMLESGRLCLAGVNDANIAHVCAAIQAVSPL